MPVYEFRCVGCDEVVETVRAMGQTDPPEACPACGGRMRRRWSRVGVRFQGWGFSSTDDLLPEDRRARRDYKQLKEKADEITES